MHPQLTQTEEASRADRARIPHRTVIQAVFVFRHRHVARSHVVIQLQGATKFEAADWTRMGLDHYLHVIQKVLIGTHGRQVGWDCLERRRHHRRLIGEHRAVLKQGTTDR